MLEAFLYKAPFILGLKLGIVPKTKIEKVPVNVNDTVIFGIVVSCDIYSFNLVIAVLLYIPVYGYFKTS